MGYESYICHFIGLNYIIQTGKGADLQQNWMTTRGHVFTFKVTACNDATVALGSPALPGFVAYNITIGMFQYLYLRKHDVHAHEL